MGRAHGNGPRDHPLLKDLNLPPLGNSTRGHPLLTKTLLFIAEATVGRGTSGGDANVNFRAYNKTTGALVAELFVPGGPTGTPMTYAIDGRQYITVAVGGMRNPSKLVTLALPR